LSRDKGLCQLQLTSTPTNLLTAEFFVEKVEGLRAATSNVLPPPYVRRDMMQLRNFCQVSIEEEMRH